MIDVLYIKGIESPNKDLEILYSLRSLEKCVKDVGRVFVTGKRPSFVTNVIHTPADDIGCRMINHWWKVTQTILNTDISDDFILMYDDIFFTREITLSDYPPYNRGELMDHNTGTSAYRRNLEESRKWLSDRGYTTLDFELHIPMIYNREKFLKLKEFYESYIKRDIAPAVRSMYGNINKVSTKYREDLKLRGKDNNIGNYECFSTSDESFKYLLDFLKENFTERSKYENSLLPRRELC